jgi:hypothetical protein
MPGMRGFFDRPFGKETRWGMRWAPPGGIIHS